MDKELMKGSIDILLLTQISHKDTYGFEIIKNIKAKSNNEYSMSEGTLYPALQRLELKGLITSYWGESDAGGRRKYYSITDQGKKELTSKIKEWNKINEIINSCMEELPWISLESISTQ